MTPYIGSFNLMTAFLETKDCPASVWPSLCKVLNRVACGASSVALGSLSLFLHSMEMFVFDCPVVKQTVEKPCAVLVQDSALVQKLM